MEVFHCKQVKFLDFLVFLSDEQLPVALRQLGE
jgi:hypothetical protein